jgi:hypothetical protein
MAYGVEGWGRAAFEFDLLAAFIAVLWYNGTSVVTHHVRRDNLHRRTTLRPVVESVIPAGLFFHHPQKGTPIPTMAKAQQKFSIWGSSRKSN